MERIGVVLENVIHNLKGLLISKKEIEGFLLYSDSTNKTSLLLVEDGPNLWKTRWFSDREYTYKTPAKSINTVFK